MSTSLLPMLYHVHGIGRFDFSSMTPADVAAVDDLARRRGVTLVPTIFLRREYVEPFERVCAQWRRERADGGALHVEGFGVEGPLLGLSGGVPPAGCWMPDVATWRRIAALGRQGLRYLVIAPDALGLRDELEPGFLFRDLVDLLAENGVRLALGHFRHDDASRSADLTAELIDYVACPDGTDRHRVVTDHLYNDMPRAFVHAWRTEEARARRADELAAVLDEPWSPDMLPSILGPVPATLIEAARQDLLTPMLNFDGHHVDLEICRATTAYLGAERLIAITDHIEVMDMAGEALRRDDQSTLLLRGDRVVAAGSTGLDGQIANMRSIGLTDHEIDLMTRVNPQRSATELTVTNGVGS